MKAAVSALKNTRGLSWPTSFEQQRQRSGDLDLLDWLRAMFGFQACFWIFGPDISLLLKDDDNELLFLICTEGQCQEPKGAFDIAPCKYSYQTNSQAWTTKQSMFPETGCPLNVIEFADFYISLLQNICTTYYLVVSRHFGYKYRDILATSTFLLLEMNF